MSIRFACADQCLLAVIGQTIAQDRIIEKLCDGESDALISSIAQFS
jgi:hypothetical protein